MKKYLVLVSLVLLVSAKNIAQPFFDVAHLSFQQSNSSISNMASDIKFQTNLYAANVSVPVKIKNDNLVISCQYENQQLGMGIFSSGVTVYSLGLPVSYVHQWKKEKWKTAFVFIPKANGVSLVPYSKNMIQLGGAVLSTYKKKETLKYKFGAYYNSEFFGPYFLPLIGIDWNINKKLNFFGLMPQSLTLEYKATSHFHLGMSVKFITASYHSMGESFVRLNDNQPRLFFDFYFATRHMLSAEAGYTVLREYRTGIRTAGETDYLLKFKNDGMFFRIAYAYRIRLDETK